jgi:hypothetical protein
MVSALAAATIGCGGGATTVRPFVKRGGESPAEKTPQKPEGDGAKPNVEKGQ